MWRHQLRASAATRAASRGRGQWQRRSLSRAGPRSSIQGSFSAKNIVHGLKFAQTEPVQAAVPPPRPPRPPPSAADAEPTYAELAVSKRRGERSRSSNAISSHSVAIYATIDHTAAWRKETNSATSSKPRLFARRNKLQSSKSNDV